VLRALRVILVKMVLRAIRATQVIRAAQVLRVPKVQSVYKDSLDTQVFRV
jgi:hypothetical protein